MKRLFLKFTAFLLLFSAVNSFASAAERYNLVLFYADWNVYSQAAISTLSKVAENSKQISFEQINIDDKKAFYRMKQLGVMPVDSIPYYFVMDKNKKIIYGSRYANESAEELTKTINNRINN